MPVDVPATWANAPDASSEPEYDAGELRLADSAIYAASANGVPGGIVLHQDASLTVAVDGSDQVTVQPGAAVLPGDAVTGQGVYRTALPAVHSEPLVARHATWGRIDLVVFRMLDVDVVAPHGVRTARLEVIAGTPSSTPAVPAKPSMAVELGRITVPAASGGAATVDGSFRDYACAAGGELLAASFARLPLTAVKWQRARATDTLAVAFAHPFDVPPRVFVSSYSHTYFNTVPSGIGTMGFTISVRNVTEIGNSGPLLVNWSAERRV